ncbi:MAG: hypothetical protein JNM80_05435 [Phycisphaerae bacterium]|nr:hypothetical protein [Phycisphaerae bacterium]
MRMLATVSTISMLGMGLVGCSSGMGRYNIRVTPSDDLRAKGEAVSLKMDLVAVGDDKKAEYESMPIDEYLSRPRGRAYSMVFAGKDMKEQTLPRTDKIWADWGKENARWLFMLVDFPPDAGAARRKMIPLRADRWDKDTIEVKLYPKSIEVLTPQRPESN